MSLAIAFGPMIALAMNGSPCPNDDGLLETPTRPVVVYAEETPATKEMRRAKAEHRRRVALAELARTTGAAIRFDVASPAGFRAPALHLVQPADLELDLDVAPPELPRRSKPASTGPVAGSPTTVPAGG